MNSPYKILLVTPTFFPRIGGIEIVVFELAKVVCNNGFQADIAHVSSENREFIVEKIDGIKIYRIPMYGNRLIGLAPMLGQVTRSYDLLHVHDPQILALTANVMAFGCNKPAVLSTHGGFWHTKKFSFFKQIYEKTFLRFSLNHYHRILASSIGDFTYFSHFTDRIELCSNGVNISKFKTVLSEPAKNIMQWIYWGRLSSNKRIDLILEYVRFANNLGYPVEILICGRDFDNLLPNLQAKVNDLKLSSQVCFVPYLDEDALLVELKSRGVCITASEHEGFGLTILEAMAAGLITICRDMSPLNTFILHSKTGYFLRFDSSQEDLKTLQSIISASTTQINSVSNAARLASEEYDWNKAVLKFISNYQQILQT